MKVDEIYIKYGSAQWLDSDLGGRCGYYVVAELAVCQSLGHSFGDLKPF